VNQADIFGPLGALVALTFLVLLNVPIRRFASAFRGQTKRDDYKLGESDRVPGWVAVANRNLMNLFELPVLFYVLCLSLYVTDLVNERQIWLAWGYVGLRAVHSLVHLTFNNVMVRLSVFAVSNIVLITMWVQFFGDLPRAA
jgi:hypothetical protein